MNGPWAILALVVFPGGLFLLAGGLAYEWADRKLLALLQNRVGPRLFQPLADTVKLLAKEEIIPDGANKALFIGLPIVALAGGLTAALYVPIAGLKPAYGFSGDLIVTLYLLSLLTLCMGLAGTNTLDRFSMIGATRTLTQLFSYEAPFLLALLVPAMVAGSWQIGTIATYADSHWVILAQPWGCLLSMLLRPIPRSPPAR
jgi:NADH-quinone oxidoreductase subunit H